MAATSSTFGTMDWQKVAGIGLIAIAALDLSYGNTNTPLLPAPIANLLSQQTDVILVGAGLLLLFVDF